MSILCSEDEFVKGDTCVPCNDRNSVIYIGLTMASFVGGAHVVKDIASIRHQMVRVKVLSTFYQTAQLTTMVKIQWPTIALMTLPFSLPFSDSKCLAAGSGWNQISTFYAFIYGPIVVFILIGLRYSQASESKRVKWEQMVAFLLILWYSPVLQSCASMWECFDDRDDGWVLVSDPGVSCESSISRAAVMGHVYLICFVVGVGFPGYIFSKTRQLREAGKLVAGLPLTSLFEWYTPDVPYFEAVHMIRKALLIMLTTVLSTSMLQALASFAVNAAFLLILYKMEPMVYYPSSFFKGRNLFLLVEMLSTCTSLLGNALAIIGAAVSSPAAVYWVGLVFAILNISFGFVLFFGYASDTRKMKNTIAPEIEAAGNRSQSMLKLVSGSLQKAEKEWYIHTALIDGSAEGSTGKAKMVLDVGFLRSKLEQQVKEDLVATEERVREEIRAIDQNRKMATLSGLSGPELESLVADSDRALTGTGVVNSEDKRVMKDYDVLLAKINQDSNRIQGTSDTEPLTVKSIASKNSLQLVLASLSPVEEPMTEILVLCPIDAVVGSTISVKGPTGKDVDVVIPENHHGVFNAVVPVGQ